MNRRQDAERVKCLDIIILWQEREKEDDVIIMKVPRLQDCPQTTILN